MSIKSILGLQLEILSNNSYSLLIKEIILLDLSADTCHRGLISRNLGVLRQGGRSVLVNWGQDCPSSRKVYYHGHGQEVVERVCRVRHLR